MSGQAVGAYLTTNGQVQEVQPSTPLPVIAPANRSAVSVTIANGASLSGSSGALNGKTVCGIVFPAGWSAQIVTFQGSVDGVTFVNIYADNGSAEYQIPATQATASAGCSVDMSVFQPWEYVKVRSGTSGSPQPQAGGDDVTLVVV